MTPVRRALALSFLERYFSVALALGGSMLLARLLTPEQIGQYSVSLAVIGVAQVLREFGIGTYLVQEKALTDLHIRTASGVSMLLGGMLFVAVVVAAPLLARFYDAPEMAQTLWIVALNFLVLPLCTVRMALLRREMKFKPLVSLSLAAATASQLATVLLAWQGVGADSMAVGSVVNNLAMAIGLRFVDDPTRRPWQWPSLALWRPLLRFGGQTALTNVVTTVSIDANDLVVGKVLGFGPVAMISRAQGLMNLVHRDIMGAVRNVALPSLAQSQREGQDTAAQFRRGLTLLTVVAWPLYGFIALYALEALRLLFGAQWDAARPLVVVYCSAGAVATLSALCSSVLLAAGQIGRITRFELVVQPLRLAAIAAAVLTFRTMESAAWAYLASALLMSPAFLWVAGRGMPGLLRGLVPMLARSLAVSAVVIGPAAVHVAMGGWARATPLPLAEVALAAAAGVALGLVALARIDHPMADEPVVAALLRQLRLR